MAKARALRPTTQIDPQHPQDYADDGADLDRAIQAGDGSGHGRDGLHAADHGPGRPPRPQRARSIASAAAPRPEPKRAILLVLTANRGLCAGYNASVLRLANARYQELHEAVPEVRLEVAGKRGISAFRFRKMPLDKTFTHFEDKPSSPRSTCWPAAICSISRRRVRPARRGLHEVRERQPSAGGGRDAAAVGRLGGAAEERAAAWPEPQYEFLPSAASILDEVVPTSFKVQVVQVFLGRRRERADRPDGGDEGRHRERRQHDFATFDGLQPRPARADHRRAVGDYRRGGGAERVKNAKCKMKSANCKMENRRDQSCGNGGKPAGFVGTVVAFRGSGGKGCQCAAANAIGAAYRRPS